MNYLPNEIAKEFKEISKEIESAKTNKRHNVRCKIEAIKDTKALNETINMGHLS